MHPLRRVRPFCVTMKKIEKIEAVRDGKLRKFHPSTWEKLPSRLVDLPNGGVIEEPKQGYVPVGRAESKPIATKQEIPIPQAVQEAKRGPKPKNVNED